MKKIIIAVGRQDMNLSFSNTAYREALLAAGCAVDVLAWNDNPVSTFLGADLVVLRQTWDFQLDPGGYASWLMALKRLGVNIQTPPDLAVWNNDKRTLMDLKAIGVKVPNTRQILTGKEVLMFDALQSDTLVIKPVIGGSGNGVRKCTRDTISAELADAMKEAPGRHFMAQEFLTGIHDGEWSFTCIDGKIAFAVLAKPREGEFRINSRFSPTKTVETPPAKAHEAAEKILHWLGEPLLACRIDGVMQDGDFVCTELELTDPDLNLHRCEGEAETLAAATIRYASCAHHTGARTYGT